MLLQDNRWPYRLLGSLLLAVLLLCGQSSAKKSQPLDTTCTKKVQIAARSDNGTSDEETILYYAERDSPNAMKPTCTRFAWSTVGYPTLFISQDRNKCECDYRIVNKEEYMVNQSFGSVNISGTDSYFSMAIVFTRLLEFKIQDKKFQSYSYLNVTEACMCDNQTDSHCEYHDMDLSSEHLNWTLADDSLTARNSTSNDYRKFLFTINTKFPSKVDFDRLKRFPRAQISENATLIDLVVQNITYTLSGLTEDADNLSRIALEMYIIHGPGVKNGTTHQDKYLDDEYTPSVFSSWSYNVSGNDNDSKVDDIGGYLHWKPISYQDGSRKSTVSQQNSVVSAGDSPECNVESLPKGLATALFDTPAKVSNVTRWFVVFGTEGDDTYLNSQYSTWTLVVGYGDVPSDRLSATVIITIIVGLGIPGLLVLVGGVYVFIKKKPWQNASRMISKARGRAGYAPIQN